MIRYLLLALFCSLQMNAFGNETLEQNECECCERPCCHCLPPAPRCYNPDEDEFYRRRNEASWPGQRDGILQRMTHQ